MCRRELRCFLLFLRCGPQVSLLSSIRSRYLASLKWWITELLKETSGQSLGLRVKVIWVDLSSFTLIFHVLHHFESILRWFWRWWEKMSGTAVSGKNGSVVCICTHSSVFCDRNVSCEYDVQKRGNVTSLGYAIKYIVIVGEGGFYFNIEWSVFDIWLK